jgi:hypothetical protein
VGERSGKSPNSSVPPSTCRQTTVKLTPVTGQPTPSLVPEWHRRILLYSPSLTYVSDPILPGHSQMSKGTKTIISGRAVVWFSGRIIQGTRVIQGLWLTVGYHCCDSDLPRDGLVTRCFFTRPLNQVNFPPAKLIEYATRHEPPFYIKTCRQRTWVNDQPPPWRYLRLLTENQAQCNALRRFSFQKTVSTTPSTSRIMISCQSLGRSIPEL